MILHSRALFLALALIAGAAAGHAAPLEKSLIPRPRPALSLPQVPAGTAVGTAAPSGLTSDTAMTPVLHPLPRPDALLRPAPGQAGAVAAQGQAGLGTSVRPPPRPNDLAEAVAAIRPEEKAVLPKASGQQIEPPPEASAKAPPAARKRDGWLFGFGKSKKTPGPGTGYVCGDPDIRGQDLAAIGSKVPGCGVPEPVRVTQIDGVRLSQPATINCQTARALKTWLDRGARPAFRGRQIVELKIAASYICRPRNNIRGAKISEHGRGNAVDVAGIVTSDGRSQMVAGGFDATMRSAYKAACGIFGTTLGPGSDGYHEDHMHFDTASYRTGSYCR